MFKNSDNPISLFSFQDIITSLTGIMLFFLIVLAINVLETTEHAEEQSDLHAEVTALTKQQELLERQIQTVQQERRDFRQQLHSGKKQDRASMTIDKFNCEQHIAEAKQRQQQLQTELEELRRKIRQQREQFQQLQSQTAEKTRSEEEIAELEEEISQQEEKLEDLERKLEEQQRTVNISVAGDLNKTPLLIECSGDSITIFGSKDLPQKVIRRQTPISTDMVQEAIDALSSYSRKDYYFVFLIKPSAALYFDFLQIQFNQKYPLADCGFEPILETERGSE